MLPGQRIFLNALPRQADAKPLILVGTSGLTL
jgi:hypothetical protein